MGRHARYDELQRTIEQHQRVHRERVTSAIRSGNYWEMIKAELARDYSALLDGFLLYGVGVDADFWASHEYDDFDKH